jgi:heterodisulfide reductase subunit B
MRYSLYSGCLAQTEQYAYELSVREVLPKLGIELVNLEGASCCGFLSFSITSPLTTTYLTARNLALAEKVGLDLLTMCNKCNFIMLTNMKKLENEKLKNSINKTLSIEDLQYNGNRRIIHLLEILYDEIGIKKIQELVKKPFNGFKLAAYPGCYFYSSRDLRRSPNNEQPDKLTQLIRALGAESPEYKEIHNCCGSDILGVEKETALKMTSSILKAIKDLDVDGIVTLCPHCFKMLDGQQEAVRGILGDLEIKMPIFYYTQLLGVAMGIPRERLGMNLNLSPVNDLMLRF